MRLLKDANISIRCWLRKVVKENKNLIASFFVDENGEPSDKKCFDIMLLPKKLSKAGIDVPPNYSDKIGPILLCFGGITYEEREVERLPEIETVEHIVIKKEKKKKKKKEEKDADNEKKEVKPIKVKAYEVNISDYGTGKSSIIWRYLNNDFKSELEAPYPENNLKKIQLGENTHIILNIWDTAGEERSSKLFKKYYVDAYGALLIFDLTNINSFKNIKKWEKENIKR